MTGSLIGDFLLLWAAVYVATLSLYLGFGAVFTWLAARHPERRIQAHRRGEKRKWKEIRQSAWSLIATCGCLAGGLFAQAQGWTLFAPLALSWWSVPLMFVVSIVAFDAWFYWAHRFMHWGPMYKHHVLHHRSVAPTVWSNYSDSMIDAFVMQSYYLWAPLILPIPPMVLIAHRLYDHFNGMIGHSGFEFAAAPSARASMAPGAGGPVTRCWRSRSIAANRRSGRRSASTCARRWPARRAPATGPRSAGGTISSGISRFRPGSTPPPPRRRPWASAS
jgi:sterol desaturase/sphingolipid hydroxylase (fatty acid hydroxylase superfamily)